jgi:Xaa-Pro dipeptidase
MRELDLNCLIAYFDGMHTFLEANYVYMLTDFKPMAESFAVLFADGRTTLLLTPAWDRHRARRGVAGCDVIGTDDLFGALKQFVDEHNIRWEETGLLGFSGLSQRSWERFAASFGMAAFSGTGSSPGSGAGLNHVDAHVLPILQTKTAEELKRAAEATRIAEKGFERFMEVIREGVTEYEIAGELDSYMRALGADDNFLLMSASKHNRSVRAPGDRRIERGDLILAEISPGVEGQFSQICRTVVFGESDEGRRQLLKEKYGLLLEALRQGIAAAAPGAAMSSLVTAMNAPIEAAGYGEFCHPPYMRVRGHGLGLSSILPGDVSLDNGTILQENMFFVLHPNQYIPETGYMLCGVPVRIASRGALSLCEGEPELVFID